MEVENVHNFRFPKEARLHHRSLVDGLFRSGKSFYEFPFRVTWRLMTNEELQKNFRTFVPDNIGKLQLMVTVPKKKRRNAVDRVLMRRRIREAYRLNRNSLKELVENMQNTATISVALIYIHDKNIPYKMVEEKMIALLGKLQSKLEYRSLS